MNRLSKMLCWAAAVVFCFSVSGIFLHISLAQQGNVSKLEPMLRIALDGHGAQMKAPSAAERPSPVPYLGALSSIIALEYENDEILIPVSVTVRDEGREMRSRGFPIQVQIGQIVTTKIPVSLLPELSGLPSVVRVKASTIRHPHGHDVSTPETRAPLARQSYGLSGKNVIVAVIDTGIDWRHGDFRKSDGTTRIKYLWDMSDKQGPEPAELPGTGGTVYTEQQINAALQGGGGVNEADREGHGTHVTGSAAGNGRATGAGFPAGTYAGMAPEADIIFVKGIRDDNSGFDSNDSIAALKFIDSRARQLNRSYVVNMSYGGQLGPHDGTTDEERTIDSLFGAGKPGRVVCISAGNEGAADLHASGSVPVGGTDTVTFNVREAKSVTLVDLWYDGSDTFDLSVTTPTGLSTDTVNPGGSFSGTASDGTRVRIESAQADPINGSKQIVILVDQVNSGKPILAGNWSIRLKRTGSGSGRFDAWILNGCTFRDHVDSSRRVGMPGTARNAITAASHITKNRWTDIDGVSRDYKGAGPAFDASVGDRSPFSGPGPTRDGRQKPDISAPGQAIASALSSASQPERAFILPDGVHFIAQGTSMASPHVAGAVALILEANPALDAAQVKDILTKTARGDDFTGRLPNYNFGYGKMDVFEAIKSIRGGTGTTPPTPNPVITNLDPSTIKQGSTVLVSVNGANFAGTLSLTISPSAGITVNQAGIASPSKINLNLTVSATAALGSYQVVVTMDGRQSNPGVFQVVSATTTSPDPVDPYEPNDDLVSATPLPADGRISARINPRTDIDVFKFPATQGRKMTITIDAAKLSPPSGLDSIIGVFDSYGFLLAFNDDDGATRDSYLEWTPSRTDTYFLAVAAYSDGAEGPATSGAYTLRATGHAGDIRSDATPPKLDHASMLTPRILNKTSEIFGLWQAEDPESGINYYEYAVGTTPGGSDIVKFTRTNNNSIYLTGQSLRNGGEYYLNIRAVNGAGLASEVVASEPIKVNTSGTQYPLYFPRVVAFQGSFTGIAVANPSSVPVQIIYRLYDNNGSLQLGNGITNPVAVLLDPGEQLPILSTELFSSPSMNTPGWVEILASRPDVKAFYLFGSSDLTAPYSFLDGADVSGSPMTDFVFHRVQDTSDNVFTAISLVNPNDGEASATLELRDAQGRLVASGNLSIGGKRRVVKLVKDMFPGVSQIPAGTIRVRSNLGLVGFELFAGEAVDVGGMNPQRTNDTTRNLYFAQMAVQGDWYTEISITNPNDNPIDVELRALYNNGSLVNATANPTVVHIPAWGQYNAQATQTFRFVNPNYVEGYIAARITSGTGGIFGHVLFGTSNRRALAALPVQTQGSNSFVFSQVAQGSGYFTGITLLNVDPFPALVKVEVYDEYGRLVGQRLGTISSGEKAIGLIDQFVPEAARLVGGYIKVTSDTPLISFELFGGTDLSIVAAVPPQPITGSVQAAEVLEAGIPGLAESRHTALKEKRLVAPSDDSISSKLYRAARGVNKSEDIISGWIR